MSSLKNSQRLVKLSNIKELEIKKGGGKMKKVNLYHIALYAVSEAKRRNFDPMDIVDRFTTKMRKLSMYAEDLAMDIHMIQKYKLDREEKVKKIKEELEGTREFEVLKEVINEICANRSNYNEQEK